VWPLSAGEMTALFSALRLISISGATAAKAKTEHPQPGYKIVTIVRQYLKKTGLR
jgi:hypothetical protein